MAPSRLRRAVAGPTRRILHEQVCVSVTYRILFESRGCFRWVVGARVGAVVERRGCVACCWVRE